MNPNMVFLIICYDIVQIYLEIHMIDIHCHLLPGIDDGPDTMAEAIELARVAVRNGITHSVITPHIHPGRYNNDRHSIHAVFTTFVQALADNNIDLTLGFAGEVRLSPEVIPLVERNLIPFLGSYKNQQVMLLELPHSHIPPGSDKLVQWLLKHNILPMIAHPERNKDIMRSIDKILPFIEMGCLFQLTANSVAGLFGEMAEQRSKDLLAMGCVTVIASDAHNYLHRPPRLDQAIAPAAAIIGIDNAKLLVSDNPMKIVSSQFDVLV